MSGWIMEVRVLDLDLEVDLVPERMRKIMNFSERL